MVFQTVKTVCAGVEAALRRETGQLKRQVVDGGGGAAVAAWPAWCVPKCTAERVGLYLLCGRVKEGQVTTRKAPRDKVKLRAWEQSMGNLLIDYAAFGEKTLQRRDSWLCVCFP